MAENSEDNWPGIRKAMEEKKTAVKPPGLKMHCSQCGGITFWLTGMQVTAVCTQCGDETELGINAFTIS